MSLSVYFLLLMSPPFFTAVCFVWLQGMRFTWLGAEKQRVRSVPIGRAAVVKRASTNGRARLSALGARPLATLLTSINAPVSGGEGADCSKVFEPLFPESFRYKKRCVVLFKYISSVDCPRMSIAALLRAAEYLERRERGELLLLSGSVVVLSTSTWPTLVNLHSWFPHFNIALFWQKLSTATPPPSLPTTSGTSLRGPRRKSLRGAGTI